MINEKFSTARRGFRLACIVVLCVGAAVATWAVGEVPQSEVYDGLANTTYSSGYMNRERRKSLISPRRRLRCSAAMPKLLRQGLWTHVPFLDVRL